MEPLILYMVLFFPGIFSSSFSGELAQGIVTAEIIPFSISRELGRTLTYTAPALALLWYLATGRKSAGKKNLTQEDFLLVEGIKPHKQDLVPLAAGLPGLIIIGLCMSFLVSFLSKYPVVAVPPKIGAPVNVSGWIVMVFSCLGTGYLEESYFRYYLLIKLETVIPFAAARIFVSTVLFAFCHIYEGPLGVLNAVLAGVLLSILFVRYRSLHGIALAHAGYNVFVYAMGIF